jgi:ABC-type transport system involved in multi-copper enzyme maturation permease subunit
MIGRIWAIALNTFREAARIRVIYGILVLVVAANLAAIVAGRLSINEQTRVARDFGLASISFLGAMTAIFLGVFLLYSEVQRRTIYAIVTRPIARWEFVVGKYGGMVLVLSVLVAMFAGAMVAILTWQGVGVTMALGKAVMMSWVEVMTVAAIAVFFSAFSSPFLSGIFALALFVIGRLTPDLRNAAAGADAPWIRGVAKATLNIVPDLHLFAISGGTVGGEHVSVHGDFVSWGYVASAAGHGLLWIVALLVASCLIFERRDFV